MLQDSRVFCRGTTNILAKLQCVKFYRMAFIEFPILVSWNKQVKYPFSPNRILFRIGIFASSKKVTEFGVQNLDSAPSEGYFKKRRF